MRQFITHAGIAVLCIALHLLSFSTKAAENYYLYNRHHQGYSMTESHDPDNIVVAGSICNNPLDCKILVQETNKTTGAVVWSMEYNWNSGSERCFNILKTSSGYLLTGYAFDGPNHVTYVMDINASGAINWVKRYHDGTSVGLYSLECSDGSGYVVAGYLADQPGSSSTNRTGYIMKINTAGNLIWNRLYDSPKSGQDYDMAEQVIEVPGSVVPNATTNLCYYVTGSVNFTYTDPWNNTSHYQKVQSLMLDDNGNVTWQQAFTTGTPPMLSGFSPYTEVGVSSLYDASQNVIFLVSNAENSHGFHVSRIDPANGNVLAHKAIWDASMSTNCKLAAYQVHDKDANTLSVVGFIHNYDWSSSTPHNPTFAIDVDKGSLNPGNINVFEIPSNGHNSYFAAWLGTPATSGYPTIHTPDLSYQDGDYLWLVCYITNPVYYDLAIQRVTLPNYTDACDPEDYTSTYQDIETIQLVQHFTDQNIYLPISFTDNSLNPSVNECVPQPPSSKPTSVTTIQQHSDVFVYPSAASTTLNIAAGNSKVKHVLITDIAGRSLFAPVTSENTYDVSRLATGTYIIKITTEENEVYTERFFKK